MIETELKLAVPLHLGAGLARQLMRSPALAGCKRGRLQLHNIYFDTPGQSLRQHGIALRLRRVGTGARARWWQTLKTVDADRSAMSRRGEWESPVQGPVLAGQPLQTTPWAEFDPDGTLLQQLVPCFSTDFTRSWWLVETPEGDRVEVALDLGQIHANGTTDPVCELELELKRGDAGALFAIARQLAEQVPLFPADLSKADRGYALARGCNAALEPRPVPAAHTRNGLARTALRAGFGQFTTCLAALRSSDDPELLHQARVGWRRFQTARKLFKSTAALPSLRPLLAHMGAVRDLDVARTETLPGLAAAFMVQDPSRASDWRTMSQALERRAVERRADMHQALDAPAIGQALIAITQWLEAPVQTSSDPVDEAVALRPWALRKVRRQRQRLRMARGARDNTEHLHQVRLRAKQLRYGIEALQGLLPPRRAERWRKLAVRLQSGIGARRDAVQAVAILHELGAHPVIAAFLRGYVAGRESTRKYPMPT